MAAAPSSVPSVEDEIARVRLEAKEEYDRKLADLKRHLEAQYEQQLAQALAEARKDQNPVTLPPSANVLELIDTRFPHRPVEKRNEWKGRLDSAEIITVGVLRKLDDAQWARLGLPIGVEQELRDVTAIKGPAPQAAPVLAPLPPPAAYSSAAPRSDSGSGSGFRSSLGAAPPPPPPADPAPAYPSLPPAPTPPADAQPVPPPLPLPPADQPPPSSAPPSGQPESATPASTNDRSSRGFGAMQSTDGIKKGLAGAFGELKSQLKGARETIAKKTSSSKEPAPPGQGQQQQ